jgi:hypothetical protein
LTSEFEYVITATNRSQRHVRYAPTEGLVKERLRDLLQEILAKDIAFMIQEGDMNLSEHYRALEMIREDTDGSVTSRLLKVIGFEVEVVKTDVEL